MPSRLYECRVLHARLHPRAHRFAYRLFFLALDLDELPALARRLRVLRIDRPGLLSFHQRDHLPLHEPPHNPSPRARRIAADGSPLLKDRVRAVLAAHDIAVPADARVLLLTLPRVLGYLFNPVSFYFVSAPDGRPLAALAEVTNTFRETKAYVLGPETLQDEPGLGPTFRLRVPKFFYVSPFSDVDVHFDFRLRPPGERLVLQIDDHAASRRTLVSTVASIRPPGPLRDRALLWFSLKYPLVTLKVVAAIHWEALRLWAKRVPWFAKSARADSQTDLRRPHASLSPPPAFLRPPGFSPVPSLPAPMSQEPIAPLAALSAPACLADKDDCGPLCRRMVLRALRDMRRGHLRLQLPEGGILEFGSRADAARTTLPAGLSASAFIRVHRPAFFGKCVLGGDIGFGESYLDGDWDSPDLVGLVAWFILNLEHNPLLSGSPRRSGGGRPFLHWLRFVDRLRHLLRSNTRGQARRNIAAHYDLSNEFFQLFLDPSMMYSGARWPAHAPELGLEQAQREKNDALCRALRLKPSDHVLEIGSGWGGWCIHAATTHGCRVTSLTLSRKQHDFARRRVQEAGLADRVDIRLEDYRDHRGVYDKIVSIEMMEAVGHRHLPRFCETLAARLKPEGLLALQFITCPDSRYDDFRRGVDFIQKHVFPGSLLLSLNRVNQELSRAGGFVLHRLEDLGPDYARTLRLWREAFEEKRDQVAALGFDESFVRKWRYYLGYCEAAFAMRNISVVQTLHTRANNLAL